MSYQITTAAELDALPAGRVVLDRDGDAWQKQESGTWNCTVRLLNTTGQPAHSLAAILGPLTPLRLALTITAEQVEAGARSLYRAMEWSGCAGSDWDRVPDGRRDIWRDTIRAALPDAQIEEA